MNPPRPRYPPAVMFFKRRKFAAALELEAAGRLAEARERYEAIAAASSGAFRAECLARAGACSTRLGELARSRKDFEAARDADPSDASHWLNYANACHRLGDGLGADEAYAAALERAPERPDILHYQSVYYADKLAKAGLEGSKRSIRVLLDRLDRPGGEVEISSLGFPVELPFAFLRNLCLEKQFVEEGLAALKEIADRRPGTGATAWARPAALNHRGLLLANAGRYDEAVADYEASLALRASDDVVFNLGMVQVRRHDWDSARKHFAAYSKRHPTSPVTTFGLAILAETKGDAAEAVRLYKFFLARYDAAPTSPGQLMTLDLARAWAAHAREFLAALQRPSQGGVFETDGPAPEGTTGDVTDRPRGV